MHTVQEKSVGITIHYLILILNRVFVHNISRDTKFKFYLVEVLDPFNQIVKSLLNTVKCYKTDSNLIKTV